MDRFFVFIPAQEPLFRKILLYWVNPMDLYHHEQTEKCSKARGCYTHSHSDSTCAIPRHIRRCEWDSKGRSLPLWYSQHKLETRWNCSSGATAKFIAREHNCLSFVLKDK